MRVRTFTETDSTSLCSADCVMKPSLLKESRNLMIGSILTSSAGSKLLATKATIFCAIEFEDSKTEYAPRFADALCHSLAVQSGCPKRAPRAAAICPPRQSDKTADPKLVLSTDGRHHAEV